MSGPRILIGTLHVDENEFDACKEALSAQTYTSRVHHVISGQPNAEAHRQLYRHFMDNRDDYELFIKLDADMVLRTPQTLAQIVGEFEKAPDLDHAVFLVHDWISDLSIIGMHVFSNRVSWDMTDEQLFVDPDPQRPGQKKIFTQSPSPVALHSPDPTPGQAFRFGVHRSSKILQPSRWWVDRAQADFQWTLLTSILTSYQREGDRRRLLALLGAQWRMSGKQAGKPDSYTDARVAGAFDELAQDSDEALAARLSPAWRSRVGRIWLRYRHTALRSAISGIGRAGVRAARSLRQA